ncbi:hypothetical protein H6G80_29990 [Nostoc sp. FACHB-87]|uniref:hypothetical protein n=1 Tax=Nostocaceae TaxID=1162 RepID=UPI001687BC85|nr:MULTISPECIES: hypothetical protein [Nostocaceae]MBD2303239.1 hypothetical protein [Nostoc sp. FACHB-190]MBD2458285.1 hypothetical protein [Nostoc sp. FACHB-87]MBD2480071.1 hypothetical protein [Anabaena sp. FACHB-83]
MKLRLSNGTKKAEEQLKYEVTSRPFISWELLQRIVVVLTLSKMVIELLFMFSQFYLYQNNVDHKFQKLPPINRIFSPKKLNFSNEKILVVKTEKLIEGGRTRV